MAARGRVQHEKGGRLWLPACALPGPSRPRLPGLPPDHPFRFSRVLNAGGVQTACAAGQGAKISPIIKRACLARPVCGVVQLTPSLKAASTWQLNTQLAMGGVEVCPFYVPLANAQLLLLRTDDCHG